MSAYLYKHQRIVLAVLIILFLLSLIPIFMVAGVDCASGDDYNYGAGAHLSFISTGSVWAAILAAVTTTINTWHNWQGTWFDCFLFCLHPEVFSDSAYVIVPYIFVIMQVVCFSYFAWHFLKRHFGISGLYFLEISLIYLLFVFQLVPSQKSAFFWWVGSIHYAMPMCLALVGIVKADNYLLYHKISDLVMLSIIAAMMGGATYPAALLLVISVFLLWLAGFVLSHTRDKRNLLLLIPLLLETIGLTISMLAPGNAVRSASDIADGATPTSGVLSTIMKSVTFSITDGLTGFIGEKTFILIAFILIGIISVEPLKAARENDQERFNTLFNHPVVFVLVMFLLNASIYTPRLYAGNHASSGYNNFNFWVFTVCISASIIYIAGCLISKDKLIVNRYLMPIIFAFAVLAIMFFGRHGVKQYTDYVCLDYYLSGQAHDYKEQMALQRYLMEEDGVDDVVVPEINDYQGPLMHMPIVSDQGNVDNLMTKSFYGKNSCRSLPREQWMEEYKDKYSRFYNG